MRWIISALVVLTLAAGLWWWDQQRQAELVPQPETSVSARPDHSEPRYPLPEPEPPVDLADKAVPDAGAGADRQPEPERPTPLPALADSDAPVRQTLAGLLGDDFVRQRIKPEFIIARSVALINSLDGPAPALKAWPLEPLDGKARTEEIEGSDALLWPEDNAARYAGLVDTLESVPPRTAAALYRRYYPLFEQAWTELGEPEPYFNDRLIDIIDRLLAAPEVGLPFPVVPHEGHLRLADETLEAQPWGCKLLIRMGPENAGRVKEWLRQFRNLVVSNEAAETGHQPAPPTVPASVS